MRKIVREMAPFFKQCIVCIVLLLWQVSDLESTCPEVCECKDNTTSCRTCSYNITVKETTKIYKVYMCCNENIPFLNGLKHVNKTYTEVVANYGINCNKSDVIFDFPYMDTYSLSLRNNSIINLKINIKSNNVRDIDLSKNKLRYVTKGLFSNYHNVRKLILSKNNIIHIFEDSFLGLSKLETLDLSENNLTILSNVFTPLKNLQHLNLSRNNIEFINENYFNNWLLQHLDVSHNNLRKLEPGALQLLPNLARLLLTDNPHLGITQLDTQLLVGTGRRLQQIDASRTGLYQVPEAFTHSVRFLSLVGNRITSIRCGDLDSYPLLQSLDFSDNKIVMVEDDSLGRLEMLLFLNINNNFLINVPKSLPYELKYLSMNNNSINNISKPDFKNLPNLRILLLKNNKIRYIQDNVFDDLLSLEILDLSNNPIQTLSPSTFDGPLSLRDLRLCYLNLTVAEQDGSFPMSSPESVQMLHLQSSPGLAKQLLADSAALAALSHLLYLDLRMNNITDVRNDLLFYLVQLKTLRLHGNNINCSTELWLTEWMNWNKSLSNEETCYFSTSEGKSDVSRYNCTFPETFTISDSLPPVNLYSTEMINKLLRYYGYLNNKTERGSSKHNFTNSDYKNISTHISNVTQTEKMEKTNDKSQIIKKVNPAIKMSRNLNKIISKDVNETYDLKARETSKILDQNKIQNDQLHADRRFFDIGQYLPLPTRNPTVDSHDDANEIGRKKISGRRLNTPVTKESMPYVFTTRKQDEYKYSSNEPYTTNPNDKLHFSPYQATHTNYAQYIGTVAISSLIVMSLILWASFRLRYRRRQGVARDAQVEDQIEVSNISGGVLW